MHAKKRAKTAATAELIDALPCFTGLAADMDTATERAIIKRYFDPSIHPNRFKYSAIIQSGGNEPYQVINTLKHEGAFSS
jgi:hypothetical protein